MSIQETIGIWIGDDEVKKRMNVFDNLKWDEDIIPSFVGINV